MSHWWRKFWILCLSIVKNELKYFKKHLIYPFVLGRFQFFDEENPLLKLVINSILIFFRIFFLFHAFSLHLISFLLHIKHKENGVWKVDIQLKKSSCKFNYFFLKRHNSTPKIKNEAIWFFGSYKCY